MRFDDLDGPAGGARGEAGARERDAGTPQSTGARSHLAQLQGTIPHLQALVEQWKDEAEKDHHTATDDVSDGIWAYQHEAAGRARAKRQCADQLLAVLVSPKETTVRTEQQEESDARVDTTDG
jgi:hypothetical protein